MKFTISPVIALGLPKATLTWSRNGEDVDPNDPRVNISSEGVLTVTDIQTSDTGIYTVTASNIAAPDGVMASVNVFAKICKSYFLSAFSPVPA